VRAFRDYVPASSGSHSGTSQPCSQSMGIIRRRLAGMASCSQLTIRRSPRRPKPTAGMGLPISPDISRPLPTAGLALPGTRSRRSRPPLATRWSFRARFSVARYMHPCVTRSAPPVRCPPALAAYRYFPRSACPRPTTPASSTPASSTPASDTANPTPSRASAAAAAAARSVHSAARAARPTSMAL